RPPDIVKVVLDLKEFLPYPRQIVMCQIDLHLLRYGGILCLLLAIMLPPCFENKQTPPPQTSRLLGTLSPQMHKGEEGEALLIYKTPKIALIPRGTYKKMLLDPTEIWSEPTTDPVKQANAQKVADLFYSLTYQGLSKDYEMVSEPGPGT